MISIVRYHERAVSKGLQRFIVTRVEGEASFMYAFEKEVVAQLQKILLGLAAQCSNC